MKIIHFFASLFFLYLLYVNISLYNNIEIKSSYNLDIRKQLAYIEGQLNKGVDKKMQSFYPEGYYFSNVLYGITWCEFLQNIDKSDSLFIHGLQQINKSQYKLESNLCKYNFHKDITPERGVFYLGWKNYLLAKKLILLNSKKITPKEDDVNTYLFQTKQLVDAYTKKQIPFLESYTALSWPADNTVAVASIGLFEKIIDDRYHSFIKDWVKKAKVSTDSLGLLPHKVDYQTNQTLSNGRGCSMSLMLTFLPDIDKEFAKQQFNLYYKYFLDKRLFLPGIREYPLGINGKGDVDSGPVILQIGGSASIVGIKSLVINGKTEDALKIRNCVEGFGAALTIHDKKRYLFGTWIMADIFIAWANASFNAPASLSSGWALPFHILSCCLLFAYITPFIFKKWIAKKNHT